MKVLVTVASKHGATAEIGKAIAATLTEEGHQVDVLEPIDVRGVTKYDAVILGSGVYAGHWIGAAKEFADDYAADLKERPVWLFSSGPTGDEPRGPGDPVDLPKLVEQVAPREHRMFGGALIKERMGFAERAIIGLVKAPYGDYRDWDEIAAWARGIAATLWRLQVAREERKAVEPVEAVEAVEPIPA
jgi:menaquinone-dependent protoporphyrinogen oxidase